MEIKWPVVHSGTKGHLWVDAYRNFQTHMGQRFKNWWLLYQLQTAPNLPVMYRYNLPG